MPALPSGRFNICNKGKNKVKRIFVEDQLNGYTMYFKGRGY